MYVTQYVPLFVAGVLLSVAAYTRDHMAAAFVGVFVWFVIGNGSTAVVFFDGSGTRHVATSVAITWLCYANAAIHAFIFVTGLRDQLSDSATDPNSADALAQQVDTGDLQDTPTGDIIPGQNRQAQTQQTRGD
jgi:hypothetical protein